MVEKFKETLVNAENFSNVFQISSCIYPQFQVGAGRQQPESYAAVARQLGATRSVQEEEQKFMLS